MMEGFSILSYVLTMVFSSPLQNYIGYIHLAPQAGEQHLNARPRRARWLLFSSPQQRSQLIVTANSTLSR